MTGAGLTTLAGSSSFPGIVVGLSESELMPTKTLVEYPTVLKAKIKQWSSVPTLGSSVTTGVPWYGTLLHASVFLQ
jgi:hypothetical protein